MHKKYFNDKHYRKVRDHCLYTGKYRGTVHSMCNLKYNYHFIITELVYESEGEFNCLGESTEKYNLFSSNRRKRLKEFLKIKKKSQKPYLKKSNLSTTYCCKFIIETF